MKVKMKLIKSHPNKAMSFGRHMITYKEEIFELNKEEIEDLKNAGPKIWFSVKKVEKQTKKVTKKATKKVK